MSYENAAGHITGPVVRSLDGIPEAGLRPIPRVPTSHSSTASQQSSRSCRLPGRGERCFLTKTICYTHEQAHFLNAVRHARGSGRKEDIENIIRDLGVVSDEFHLDSPENLVNLDRVVHKAMDAYALIAFTCANATLDDLINLIKTENDRRQRLADTTGFIQRRYFNFMADSFLNPEYELVALYPEHFLPAGRILVIVDPTTSTRKTYIPSGDRMLRETQDPSSPKVPSFSFTRDPNVIRLNPFAVILSAGIKFRRFLRDIAASPLPEPLPAEATQLINKTLELVDLLYWKVTPRSGTLGHTIWSTTLARRNATRRSPSGPLGELEDDVDMSGSENENDDTGGIYQGGQRRSRFVFPEGASLDRRIEIAETLMSGHDLEFDSGDEVVLEEIRSGSTVSRILQSSVPSL